MVYYSAVLIFYDWSSLEMDRDNSQNMDIIFGF